MLRHATYPGKISLGKKRMQRGGALSSVTVSSKGPQDPVPPFQRHNSNFYVSDFDRASNYSADIMSLLQAMRLIFQ